MSQLHVAIIGAGLGGLALAQALMRSGIAFDVYERDPAPDSRIQGYRIRIDADGQRALAAVLPDDLHSLVGKTASSAVAAGRFISPQFADVAGRAPETWRTDDTEQGGEATDLRVNRQTLREILMCGIETDIHFGHGLDGYRMLEDGRVELVFDGADPVVTDVVVGADGVHSRVRQQLAPEASPIDTGAACVYGKTALKRSGDSTAVYSGTSVVFADGFAAIMDEMRFGEDLPAIARRIAPGCRLTTVDDYFYWAMIGPRERLGLASDDCAMPALGDILSSLTENWHPQLREIVTRSDLSDVTMLPVRSGRPDIVWASGPVTLLGDAVHAMSPAGGVGANTALKDAAALGEALAKVGTRHGDVVQAIAAYEPAMRSRAIHAVEASTRAAARLFERWDAAS